MTKRNFMKNSNIVCIIAKLKVCGDVFEIAVKKCINYKHETKYSFGRLYQIQEGFCFESQGLNESSDKYECIKQAATFFGLNPHFFNFFKQIRPLERGGVK